MNTVAFSRQELSVKPILYAGIALCISFGLFVLMAKLIEVDEMYVSSPQPTTVGPVVLQLEEEKTQYTNRIKPKPETIKPPPTVPQDTPDDSVVETKNTFSVAGPVIDKVKIGNNFSLSSRDQDVRPVVRVDPSYPASAARDGIEGWVSLRFTIDPLGSVRDIEIIDSEPKRLFDREARRALAKWKYQPRKVDGKAVSQTGIMVMLEFSLEQ